MTVECKGESRVWQIARLCHGWDASEACRVAHTHGLGFECARIGRKDSQGLESMPGSFVNDPDTLIRLFKVMGDVA